MDELDQVMDQMETAVAKVGYRIMEGELGFSWETDAEASEDFYERADAVKAAYDNLQAGGTIDPEA